MVPYPGRIKPIKDDNQDDEIDGDMLADDVAGHCGLLLRYEGSEDTIVAGAALTSTPSAAVDGRSRPALAS